MSSVSPEDKIKKHNARALWLQLQAKNRTIHDLEHRLDEAARKQTEIDTVLVDVKSHWSNLSDCLQTLAARFPVVNQPPKLADFVATNGDSVAVSNSYLGWVAKEWKLGEAEEKRIKTRTTGMNDNDNDLNVEDDEDWPSSDSEDEKETENRNDRNSLKLARQYFKLDEAKTRRNANKFRRALAVQRLAVTKVGGMSISHSVIKWEILSLVCLLNSKPYGIQLLRLN